MILVHLRAFRNDSAPSNSQHIREPEVATLTCIQRLHRHLIIMYILEMLDESSSRECHVVANGAIDLAGSVLVDVECTE